MALFRSPHKGFVQVVRHRSPKRWNNVTGEAVEWNERLAADFGTFGPEYQVKDPLTDELVTVARIEGGVFDSVAQQAIQGWTDEERESVEAKLRQVAESDNRVHEVVAVAVASPAPWLTFDESEALDVPKLAKSLGAEPESLRYERENQQRPDVLAALEKAVAALSEEEQARALPIMQIPESEMSSTPQGVRIGAAPSFTDSGINRATPGFVEKPSSHSVVI